MAGLMALPGGNDGVNGHDVREEGDQQVVVCQGAHNGDGNGTGKAGQGSPLDRRHLAVDQSGCDSKGGQDQEVCQFTHAAGGSGKDMEQVLDEGDNDRLNRPHDESGEQDGQTAQVKLEEGGKGGKVIQRTSPQWK